MLIKVHKRNPETHGRVELVSPQIGGTMSVDTGKMVMLIEDSDTFLEIELEWSEAVDMRNFITSLVELKEEADQKKKKVE